MRKEKKDKKTEIFQKKFEKKIFSQNFNFSDLHSFAFRETRMIMRV
jgi:hypothetical protein